MGLAPGVAEDTIALLGRGQLLWDNLWGQSEAERDRGCRRGAASLRSSSRFMRDLINGLITEVSNLQLGQRSEDVRLAPTSQGRSFTEDPSAWSSDQQLQQHQVKALLAKLEQLVSVSATLDLGGASQLIDLVKSGSLPATLQDLSMTQRWVH